MGDPALLGTIATISLVLAGAAWGLSRSLMTGRFTWLIRTGWTYRVGTVRRSKHPADYWSGSVGMAFIVIFCLIWLAILVPAAVEGKRLHSRFSDGTAVFDNEGVKCPGDPRGFTHYHSCSGPPVPVPP